MTKYENLNIRTNNLALAREYELREAELKSRQKIWEIEANERAEAFNAGWKSTIKAFKWVLLWYKIKHLGRLPKPHPGIQRQMKYNETYWYDEMRKNTGKVNKID